MTRTTKLLAVVVTAAGAAAADAQYRPVPSQPRPVTGQPQYRPVTGQPQVIPGQPRPATGQAQVFPLYPQVPVSSSNGVIAVTPGGGVITGGQTVFNTAADPFREMSKYNGTMRQVNRPTANGGWETGYEWYNPTTGQWHGNTNVVTQNGQGGVNVQNNIRSAPPKTTPRR